MVLCILTHTQTFGSGLYRGITGFVTQPYAGAKEEGMVGFLKGAGKGTAGLIVKPGAGMCNSTRNVIDGARTALTEATVMLGLVAYPAQGVYKSIKAAKRRQAAVTQSKHLLLEWQAASGKAQSDSTEICAKYDALSRAAKGSSSN